MQLKLVSAIVAHHRGRSGVQDPAKSEEEITFSSVKVIAASFITLAFGLLIALVGPKLFSQEFVPTLGGMIFLAGMIVFLFACFRLAWLKARPRRSTPDHQAITQPDLQPPEPALLAPPIPSVTESTTRLMDEVPAVPPPQQSSGHQAG
jgi:ribose/xylose/arabinose/galactoside ABC-type transport system permease subunit